MPIPKSFPNDIERERITTLKKYQKLYDNEQYAVLGLHDIIKNQYKEEKDIIYLAHALPARISDFYSDFVSGDTEKLVIKPSTDDEKVVDFVEETIYHNDLKEKISDIAGNQSEFGFDVLIGWKDEDGIYHIDEVPQDQYFPQQDGSVIFATYKRDPDDPVGKRLVLLTQHYQLVGSDCVITREAWNTDEKGVITTSYDLQKMAAIMGKAEIKQTETLSGLDDLPIRQIDNTKRNKYGFGKSDYADIIPQLAEINERRTQIATQFLKNLDAKMQIPKEMIDEDGTVKHWEAIGVEKDSAETKYITNENTLIPEADTHILNQLKFVSFSTAVPMFQLLKSSLPERVEALRIEMFEAIRRAKKKRAKIERALNDMFRIGFTMGGIGYNEDLIFRFSEVLPIDELQQAQIETEKITSGLSSKKSAIMRLEGLSAEEAEDEMKQIEQEAQRAGVSDLNNPPVLA